MRKAGEFCRDSSFFHLLGDKSLFEVHTKKNSAVVRTSDFSLCAEKMGSFEKKNFHPKRSALISLETQKEERGEGEREKNFPH